MGIVATKEYALALEFVEALGFDKTDVLKVVLSADGVQVITREYDGNRRLEKSVTFPRYEGGK